MKNKKQKFQEKIIISKDNEDNSKEKTTNLLQKIPLISIISSKIDEVPLLRAVTPYALFCIDEKIKIIQDIPSVIKTGDEFTVTFKIHQSGITGFSRLQQYLPKGFSAIEMQSNGADFLFEDQSVKFIWEKLPSENDFTVSYK